MEEDVKKEINDLKKIVTAMFFIIQEIDKSQVLKAPYSGIFHTKLNTLSKYIKVVWKSFLKELKSDAK